MRLYLKAGEIPGCSNDVRWPLLDKKTTADDVPTLLPCVLSPRINDTSLEYMYLAVNQVKLDSVLQHFICL